MFTSQPLTIPKKAILFLILLAIFAIGCGGPPAPIPPTATPKPFNFMVRIQQQGSNKPIEDVQVILEVKGQLPIDGLSDSRGIVILEIAARQAGRVGRLIVEKDGYKSHTENLTILEDQLPDRILLDNKAESIAIVETPTAVSTEPPPPPSPIKAQTVTDTAVPPTDTPQQPTATAVPTNTATPTATTAPTGEIIAQATKGDTWLYAGPGDGNARLGSMKINDSGIVLGKDNWDGWYKVKISNNNEGWVDKADLTIISGSPDDILVIWPPSASGSGSTSDGSTTTTDLPTGGNSSSQCATVKLAFKEWPNETFDDITVSWSNVPVNTNHFIFAANGKLGGQDAPLIYPTKVEPKATYVIGLWKFAERGFTSGGTFSYALQAKNSSGTTICTTSGTFSQ